MGRTSVFHAIQGALLGALLLVLTGCANTTPRTVSTSSDTALSSSTESSQPVTPDIYASGGTQPPADALRTGRYQLVALAPSAGQRDLLKQTVRIALPQSVQLTVRAGLEHALRDSGLQLCPRDAASRVFSEPLPAVHRQLGPTTLGDALQVLAGPAWRLRVDFRNRTVCFAPRATTKAQRARSTPHRGARDA